jgi:hypothetical protein
MTRITLAIVVVLMATLRPPVVEAGDVFRSISRAVDPVVAPRAPDPDTLLPPLKRAAAGPRPVTPRPVSAAWTTTWDGGLRLPRLPLPTVPARTVPKR